MALHGVFEFSFFVVVTSVSAGARRSAAAWVGGTSCSASQSASPGVRDGRRRPAAAGCEPKARRLRNAAQTRAGNRVRGGLDDAQSDLHVDVRTKLIQRFGAFHFAVDVGPRYVRRQRRCDVDDETLKRLNLRFRCGAVAIGEEHGCDDFDKCPAALGGKNLPGRSAVAPCKPTNRLADARVESRAKRAPHHWMRKIDGEDRFDVGVGLNA